MSKHRYQTIGQVSKGLGLSADTLRYYEKIGLLPKVGRSASGIRQYTEKDLSNLRFIQRAQKMNFSLAEIAKLMKMRNEPQHAKEEIRKLTANKLAQIDEHVNELTLLRNELTLLLNLCQGTDGECPVIEHLEAGSS